MVMFHSYVEYPEGTLDMIIQERLFGHRIVKMCLSRDVNAIGQADIYHSKVITSKLDDVMAYYVISFNLSVSYLVDHPTNRK